MRQTATATSVREENAALPNAAIVYGLKELARRAGVSKDFFNSWRIEFDDTGAVKVHVEPDSRKHICFPRLSDGFKSDLRAGFVRTSTAAWPNVPDDVAALVPNFKIPFSSSDRQDVGPLFSRVNEERIDCPVDLLSSVVLTMSRFEETFAGPRDEHGRFSIFSSVAWRDDFFHRPIVDECALAMKEALASLLPGWEPQKHGLQVHLGHDVDEIGVPFSLRNSMGHTLRRGNPLATARDLGARFTGIETVYQRLLRQLVQIGLDRGFSPATYWKVSCPGPHDTGYDPRNKKIRGLMSSFRDANLELGIHLSYGAFDSLERFQSEVSALQELLGECQLGGRQDFLRWSPRTWIEWDRMNLGYDASVGYPDQIGFRAGTSYPFRPWLLSESREATLLEIPLLAMDSALFGYMKLEPDQALSKLLNCAERCKLVGGVFTTVWHNTTIMHPAHLETYRRLLDSLQGSEIYDWRNSGGGSDWV